MRPGSCAKYISTNVVRLGTPERRGAPSFLCRGFQGQRLVVVEDAPDGRTAEFSAPRPASLQVDLPVKHEAPAYHGSHAENEDVSRRDCP